MRAPERAVLVGIVVAIAIALRWAFVATGQVPQPLRADAGEYAQCALNLVEHGVYSSSKQSPPLPDSFRSPGYPAFLLLCRLAVGPERWLGLALAFQVALGGLTVLLTFLLARSWLNFPSALAACVLAALSPHLVVSSGYVLTECVTTFVLVSGLSLLSAASTRGPLAIAAAGLVLGFGVLCNETLLFVPLVAVFALWRSFGRGRMVLLLGCSLLPFAAWTVRNQTQTLTRTGAERVTASISHGSYPGMVFRDPKLKGFPYREDPAQPAFGASWANLREVLGPRMVMNMRCPGTGLTACDSAAPFRTTGTRTNCESSPVTLMSPSTVFTCSCSSSCTVLHGFRASIERKSNSTASLSNSCSSSVW